MIASISDPLLPAGWLLVAGCWLAGLPATGYRGDLAGLLACWLAGLLMLPYVAMRKAHLGARAPKMTGRARLWLWLGRLGGLAGCAGLVLCGWCGVVGGDG